jgi:hypothetical protein
LPSSAGAIDPVSQGKNAIAPGLNRADGLLQGGELLGEAVVPEAIRGKHESLEEVLQRRAAHSGLRHHEVLTPNR